MYGGYYGGWEPSEYITEDIPLTVYESKAGKPYMNLKGWAEDKADDPDKDARDELLKNVYLSAKMMKFHPLMTKELRKTYSLMASAALRAMSAEFKYGVKKEFNEHSTKGYESKNEGREDSLRTYQQERFLWEG